MGDYKPEWSMNREDAQHAEYAYERRRIKAAKENRIKMSEGEVYIIERDGVRHPARVVLASEETVVGVHGQWKEQRILLRSLKDKRVAWSWPGFDKGEVREPTKEEQVLYGARSLRLG